MIVVAKQIAAACNINSYECGMSLVGNAFVITSLFVNFSCLLCSGTLLANKLSVFESRLHQIKHAVCREYTRPPA